MHEHHIKRSILVAAFSCSLFLTGCAGNMPLGFLQEFQGTTDEAEQSESDDPALQLVKTEAEMTLEQELEALSRTGQWGEQDIVQQGDGLSHTGPYDYPVVFNRQVAVYLDLFQNKQRKTFQNWLARSGRYSSLMEKKLKQAGLPTDLVFLSMIESGYSQRAYSRAHAVGLWQFMRATGSQYHLVIDQHLDERRDAEKSTTAAVQFLGDLYRDFGDWHLAVAAYNAGPGKIRNGLEKYKVDNFWDLAKTDYLPLETKRYVPKLIAAILIARQPEKFGFNAIAYEKPLQYDTIDVGPGLNLDAVSIIAGTTTDTIKELNQELRLGKTPTNCRKYAVKIPVGTRDIAARNMDRLHSFASTDYKTHVVARGETLASICRKYDLNSSALLKVNNLRSANLKRGSRLRIPYTTIKYQLLPEGGGAMLAANKEDLILHRIKKGETISAISRKYKVPAEMIVSWNGLKSVNSIRTGQQLALYIEGAGRKAGQDVDKPQAEVPAQILASTTKLMKSVETPVRSVAAARLLKEDSIPTLAAKLSAPTLKPRKKTNPVKIESPDDPYDWYQVRSGDSLWAISRKFNVTTEEIRQWNNLSSDRLQPGARLKMKKA